MVDERQELFARIARSLHGRYDGVFSVETIERFLWDSLDRLVRNEAPRVTSFLPALAATLLTAWLGRSFGRLAGRVE